MMWFIQTALVLGIVGFLVYMLSRLRYQFIIRIRQGIPKTAHGRVAAAQLERLKAFCAGEGILSGTLLGIQRTNRISLRIRGIPEQFHQRLRNVWFNG